MRLLEDVPNVMIIGPKLNIPPLRAGMLRRARLVDKLSTGNDRRLILINGEAASGKTSLVCQWIEEDKPLVAWYSLDESDNDPDLFFRYLLSAIGGLGDRLSRELGPWLHGQRRLTGSEILPHLIQHLSTISEDVYLVLDDFHVITLPEIHKAVAQLLTQSLPRIHVVIITRHALPFSASRLKVRGQLMEISSQEMKFSYKETEELLRQILHVKLSRGQIQESNRHMEGWVGGLQLFALSLRGRKSSRDLNGILQRTSREAAGYLVDEVIDGQPEKVRSFLLATALLERFNADLCREVTGQADAGDMLDYVYRNNLFLVPMDSEGRWYRYHHLLTGAVRKKDGMSSADTRARVYRVSALWFANNGYLEDAFRYAFLSQDLEFAADMLEDYLMLLYERQDIASFRRWLSKLPRDVYEQRALLRLFDCRFKMDTVQLTEVPAMLGDIERHRNERLGRYEGFKRKRCEDLLGLLKSILPHFNDPENADMEKLQAAIQKISIENRELSAFRIAIPFSYFYKGNMHLAGEALNRAWPAVSSSHSRLAAMIWFRVAATVERFRGRLRRSESVVNDAFLFFEEAGFSPNHLKFMLDLQMAWVSYLRNDLETALEKALSTVNYLEQMRFLYEISDVYVLLSFIYAAVGHPDKISRCVQKMEWAAEAIGTPSLIALTRTLVARLWIRQGDMERADESLSGRTFSMTEPCSLRFALEGLAHTELLSARHKHREALQMLETLRARCAEGDIIDFVLQIDLLSSANLHALGHRRKARTVMEKALAFSEPEGYIRPFVDLARIVSPVLGDMIAVPSKGAPSSFLAIVSEACGVTGNIVPVRRRTEKGAFGLSRRETQILELMAVGHRNREIAEKAFISIYTAKAHIKHIFQKLGVTTKVEAIRRAEELKIL